MYAEQVNAGKGMWMPTPGCTGASREAYSERTQSLCEAGWEWLVTGRKEQEWLGGQHALSQQ